MKKLVILFFVVCMFLIGCETGSGKSLNSSEVRLDTKIESKDNLQATPPINEVASGLGNIHDPAVRDRRNIARVPLLSIDGKMVKVKNDNNDVASFTASIPEANDRDHNKLLFTLDFGESVSIKSVFSDNPKIKISERVDSDSLLNFKVHTKSKSNGDGVIKIVYINVKKVSKTINIKVNYLQPIDGVIDVNFNLDKKEDNVNFSSNYVYSISSYFDEHSNSILKQQLSNRSGIDSKLSVLMTNTNSNANDYEKYKNVDISVSIIGIDKFPAFNSGMKSESFVVRLLTDLGTESYMGEFYILANDSKTSIKRYKIKLNYHSSEFAIFTDTGNYSPGLDGKIEKPIYIDNTEHKHVILKHSSIVDIDDAQLMQGDVVSSIVTKCEILQKFCKFLLFGNSNLYMENGEFRVDYKKNGVSNTLKVPVVILPTVKQLFKITASKNYFITDNEQNIAYDIMNKPITRPFETQIELLDKHVNPPDWKVTHEIFENGKDSSRTKIVVPVTMYNDYNEIGTYSDENYHEPNTTITLYLYKKCHLDNRTIEIPLDKSCDTPADHKVYFKFFDKYPEQKGIMQYVGGFDMLARDSKLRYKVNINYIRN